MITDNFTTIILKWYDHHRRTLPWRGTTDPYPIWLSEIIMQQTRISQGISYWERFMKTYPTVGQLAAASEDDILLLWQGLGYYSRARNLHAAAKQIVAQGHFPETFDDIKKLKGVGDYTAAAIASMAFNIPVAAVDGNAYRVLSRHFGIRTPINSTEGKKEFQTLDQSLLPDDVPGKYNQAVMDFGAMQCTPLSPDCATCPLKESCMAFRTNAVGELPVKLRKTEVKERHLSYVYIRCNGETAIRKRPSGDIWQGLWEPLLVEGETLPVFDGKLTLLEQGVKHVLTHRILYADFFLLEATKKPALPAGFIWVKEEKLRQYAVPRLVELLFDSVQHHTDMIA